MAWQALSAAQTTLRCDSRPGRQSVSVYLGEHFPALAVYAIATSAIIVTAVRFRTNQEGLAMTDVVYTITVFHSLAAVAIFGFMIFSAVRLVSRQKD